MGVKAVLRATAVTYLLAAVVLRSPLPLGAVLEHVTGGADHSASHSFVRVDELGDPVAWDNCKAIHYVVNPLGAPPGWQELLASATADLTAQSGYVFVMDGTTRDREFLRRAPHAPVLVGWGHREELDRLGSEAIGLGGPATADVAGRERNVTGLVMLDSLGFDRAERSGQRDHARLVVEHELMHVLGLGHTDDPTQVMAPDGGTGDALGEGDLAGLAALRAVPCPGA